MNYELRILRVSESRAELVRAMPSGSKMFYEVKELRPAVRSKSEITKGGEFKQKRGEHTRRCPLLLLFIYFLFQ